MGHMLDRIGKRTHSLKIIEKSVYVSFAGQHETHSTSKNVKCSSVFLYTNGANAHKQVNNFWRKVIFLILLCVKSVKTEKGLFAKAETYCYRFPYYTCYCLWLYGTSTGIGNKALVKAIKHFVFSEKEWTLNSDRDGCGH